MIEIQDTIISDEVIENRFVCDLTACKGACCVEGDAGAPLEEEEASILEDIYEKVKPYMTPEGIASVEENGCFVMDFDNELVTPLINGKECAYTFFEKDGTAKCAIEKAYLNKETDFKKPISCHLYPIRLKKHETFTSVNYHHWPICKPACDCGSKLNVKTYMFLKEPLIRKFGEEWFETLKAVDDQYFNPEMR